MATLLFTALGTALGGPIGGVLGALAGQQVDAAVFGGGSVSGPRLKDLAVTTSSYGTAIPRQFGAMRVGGTIIWATDLVEHGQTSGGKGQPSVTTYSYSSSFAVALSSRPVQRVGRIWADGDLLRGADGALKVGGALRIHTGYGDQSIDPLIASSEGAQNCPAFRGLAYAVFEDLQLADFGNRIPTLTFEIFGDEGTLSLASLFDGVEDVALSVPLDGILGYACEGSLADTLSQFQPVMPMSCDAGGAALTITADRQSTAPIALPEPALTSASGEFGARSGYQYKRDPAPDNPPRVLRYYDPALDYQPGMQRAIGRALPGQPKTVDVPATIAASDAVRLIQQAARDADWRRETLAWRCAELDPAVAPGVLVTPFGQPGLWRVTAWEWRDTGIQLDLERVAPTASSGVSADPGRANLASDDPVTPTSLVAYELPWDGQGSSDAIIVQAAASSSSAGWPGAALYSDVGDGTLTWLAATGRQRSTTGLALDALAPASPLLIDRQSAVTVHLTGNDLALTGATLDQLAMGANRALLGSEIIQFAHATAQGKGVWVLSTLLRGRGGTESAIGTHAAGEAFVLLDATPVQLDGARLQGASAIAALGLADPAQVEAPILCRGTGRRPWSPVHPRASYAPDGSLTLGWTRRARGGWAWSDGVDTPLQEQSEAYLVSLGGWDNPILQWQLSSPALSLAASDVAAFKAAHPGASFAVRQQGTYALSESLTLATLG
ncbi:GTA baseplate fiber-binding domain-containing protein [Novosphingobium rosa]|uniref:GTA baseplate fiber-binding domain-containing protein n=1 Tax=Novosphingobium rosa TaxID=76978 RepID=UPI00082E0915|nr:phage tail protein [Novosphingobium rosa]